MKKPRSKKASESHEARTRLPVTIDDLATVIGGAYMTTTGDTQGEIKGPISDPS